MSTKSKPAEMHINVALDEPLTSNSCVKLVTELLKYVLYQKQQIPFTYDSLAQLQTRVKPTDRNSSSIKAIMNSLKTTSEQLSSQFHLEGCKIQEIAIIVGATIISPKLHIRIELPSQILSSQEHFDCKHASRKPLLSLMRSILECSEFQDAMASPLNPTNTFLLVQKSDRNSMSEFFLPKPQYAPHAQNSCFKIKVSQGDDTKADCNCVDVVRVYDELSESRDKSESDVKILRNPAEKMTEPPFRWYQSKEVIKGFKFVR